MFFIFSSLLFVDHLNIFKNSTWTIVFFIPKYLVTCILIWEIWHACCQRTTFRSQLFPRGPQDCNSKSSDSTAGNFSTGPFPDPAVVSLFLFNFLYSFFLEVPQSTTLCNHLTNLSEILKPFYPLPICNVTILSIFSLFFCFETGCLYVALADPELTGRHTEICLNQLP